MRYQLIFIGLYFILHSTIAFAEEQCAGQIVESVVDRVIATADMLPNYRNSVGSLKFESNRVLEHATENISQEATAPALNCPPGCIPIKQPEIIFSCIPHKYLLNSKDYEYCQLMLQKTTTSPFEYKNRTFSSVPLLSEWFSEFSQGKGDDGNDLYNRCDKSCSPQYNNQILKNNNQLVLNASVLCGPPRDKNDNQYVLTTTIRWRCIKSE